MCGVRPRACTDKDDSGNHRIAGQTETDRLRDHAPTSNGTITLARQVRSEWIKLRSLRSSWLGYLSAAALTVGLGWMFSVVRALNWTHAQPGQRVLFDPTQVSLRGIYLAQLAVGVLAVVLVTGEYATGMIRFACPGAPVQLCAFADGCGLPFTTSPPFPVVVEVGARCRKCHRTADQPPQGIR